LPFLGRRRGWLVTLQVILFLVIAGMGFSNPTAEGAGVTFFVVMAIAIAFFSASQDVVVDAFRREDLKDSELGLGSSYYIYGYRVGMLIVSGGGMILADLVPWKTVFFIMGSIYIPIILTTLWAREPEHAEKPPVSFRESVVGPFVDYFQRKGAIAILAFILLYKIGDIMAVALSTPFYLELGFSKSEIGTIVKLFGFWATLGGAFVGGAALLRIGINKALWIFGVLQMVSILGFLALAQVGKSNLLLTLVIVFENLSAGMGTAAFMAFMASITNKKFTATQYALLTSLMGVPRVFAASVTGFLAESLGWDGFFVFCTLSAIPGMLLLLKFAPWNGEVAKAES